MRTYNPSKDAAHLSHARAFQAALYRAASSGVRQTVGRMQFHPRLPAVWVVQDIA